MSQTNVQEGDVVRVAGEALVANRLVGIANSGGSPVAALPNSNTDEVPYVTLEAADSAANVPLRPLAPHQLVRVRLDGTCNPGAQLVLATPDGTVDGKVISLPAVAGTYRLVGIAEEAGVDEQLVLMRPVGQRLITVT